MARLAATRRTVGGKLMLRRPTKREMEVQFTTRFFDKTGQKGPWRLREEYKNLNHGGVPVRIAGRFAGQAFAKGWTKPIAFVTSKGIRRFNPPKQRGK